MNYFLDENIDPALRESSELFARDVEIATADPIDQTPEHQQLHAHATPVGEWPRTPQQNLNPEATSFYPPPSHESWSSDPPFQTVPTKRRQQKQQSPEWRGNVAVRNSFNPAQTSTPPESSWRSNNRFAQLSPDWSEPTLLPAQHQQAGVASWSQQPILNDVNPFMTPPSTGQYHGYADTTNMYSHQFQPDSFQAGLDHAPTRMGDGVETLSWTNISRLPADTPRLVNMAQWNQQLYSPGDRTRQDNLMPPTPTPSSRPRGRASTATSLSMNGFACEICLKNFKPKGFKTKQELDRHLRWHGERPHSCGECNKDFVAAKDLRRHQKIHKKEERHLFCNIIGCKYNHKGFGRKDHLKRHYEKRHPGGLITPDATSSGCG